MDTFESIKQSIIDTVHDYRKNHPSMSPNQDDTDNALVNYLEENTTKIQSWTQVCSLTGFYARNFQAGLDAFHKTSLPFNQVATCTPFAQGIGWYYVSACQVLEGYPYASMTLMFFRKPIMTKKVAASKGLSMNEATVWCVAGGYTYTDTNGTLQWRVIGNGDVQESANGRTVFTNQTIDSLPGTTNNIYTCGMSNSSAEDYISIQIPPVGVVDPATGNTIDFGERQPTKWSVSLTGSKGFSSMRVVINEYWTQTTPTKTSFRSVPTNVASLVEKTAVDVTLGTTSPGVWNSESGCYCACGLGSWYGSQPYLHLKSGNIGGTNLKSTIPNASMISGTNTPSSTSGMVHPSGWLDRQRISVWESSNDFICQLLMTWKMWIQKVKPMSWLWGTVQLSHSSSEDPVAYMFSMMNIDTATVAAGRVFEGNEINVNRYNVTTGEAYYNLYAKMTVEATYTNKYSPSLPFPCAYKLEVDGKTWYLRLPIVRSSAVPSYPKPYPPFEIPSLGTMLMPPLAASITGTNIECHGYLYDSDMNIAGSSFFEANAFEPEYHRLEKSFISSGIVSSSNTSAMNYTSRVVRLANIFKKKQLTFKQVAPAFFTTISFIILFIGILVTAVLVPLYLYKKHKTKKSHKHIVKDTLPNHESIDSTNDHDITSNSKSV